mmetsp:Transcript_36814/g.44536  ORF Transcript_36814/g.44536 Transcript_36814/m.44536 type:complete len:96 (-) Transcript_36814:166-453(-)
MGRRGSGGYRPQVQFKLSKDYPTPANTVVWDKNLRLKALAGGVILTWALGLHVNMYYMQQDEQFKKTFGEQPGVTDRFLQFWGMKEEQKKPDDKK